MKIGQYLTKLCVDNIGLLFLAHPVYAGILFMRHGCRKKLNQCELAKCSKMSPLSALNTTALSRVKRIKGLMDVDELYRQESVCVAMGSLVKTADLFSTRRWSTSSRSTLCATSARAIVTSCRCSAAASFPD